ncbi:MAG: hypothetical protein KJZ58_00585 [Flavobacteriales bacterium]|nr:hypothetical protein [Flavobacteriales bacterium]
MKTHLAIALAGLLSCTKGDTPGSDVSTLRSSQIGFIPIGQHQLMIVPSEEPAKHLFVLDWGMAIRPDDQGLHGKILMILQEEDGQDLVLVGAEGPMVRYTVRPNVESRNGEPVVSVIGISKVSDPEGFSRSQLGSGSMEDAFEQVYKARLSLSQLSLKVGGGGKGRTPTPEICCSGGPGATSCSSSGSGGYSCSVTCGSGYHACCDCSGLECGCKPN